MSITSIENINMHSTLYIKHYINRKKLSQICKENLIKNDFNAP
uniref:Uncharacterized protein n=1 Tax=Siphoviridae sp. ct5jB2 TaxID=2825337 RepID=A0A8S5TTV0_9CAUD|nr:MAG TPA: hypothetical protein [Siphoviridae sp. ct5jB2]